MPSEYLAICQSSSERLNDEAISRSSARLQKGEQSARSKRQSSVVFPPGSSAGNLIIAPIAQRHVGVTFVSGGTEVMTQSPIWSAKDVHAAFRGGQVVLVDELSDLEWKASEQ